MTEHWIEDEVPSNVRFKILREVDVLNDGQFNYYWSVTEWGQSWERIPEYLHQALKRYTDEEAKNNTGEKDGIS